MPDYYKILGVKHTAEPQEIKKAYRRLALQWHPDKNPGNLEEATLKFKQIAEAYEILGKSENRQAYDNSQIKYKRGGQNSRNTYNRDFDFDNNGMFQFQFNSPDDIFRDMFNEDLFENDFLEDTFPWLGFLPGIDVVMHDRFPMWDDDLFSDADSIHTHSYVIDGGHKSSRRDRRPRSRHRRRNPSSKRSTRSENFSEDMSVITTSVNTEVVDGIRVTTRRKVENGVETTSVYENDVLKSETVRGLHNVD
ncbi:unnamed protein product [Allacma fusca]|uniref:J domain-containing protein n=1 Tax=Allacma fusca TaxID=39272 RepID=A0A8J2KLP5_9HEXA|nr:unnamed protein product [Allacma fusca]